MTLRTRSIFMITALVALSGCLPTSGGDDTNDEVIILDAGTEQDTRGDEDAAVDEDTDTPDVGEDAEPDAEEPPEEIVIGGACASDAACPGGVCFDEEFPGGYCSRSCSAASPCPSGAICLEGACLDECASATECRSGYQCASNVACLPAPTTLDANVGDACDASADCGADGICVEESPDGYCTAICDAFNECPAGSRCVTVGEDVQGCFETCTADSQCREGYLCASSNLCEPEPTADDYISSFALYNPCSGSLWGSWTNGVDFNVNELQLLDANGGLLSTRTFFDPIVYWEDRDENEELFEDVNLTLGQSYTVRFKFTDGTTVEQSAVVTDALPPATSLLEVRSVDTIGNELEVTVRPSFDGSIRRATVYDTSNCQQARTVLFSPITLSNGNSARVSISSGFPAATSYKLVLEGGNSDTNYSFYDVLDFTTP